MKRANEALVDRSIVASVCRVYYRSSSQFHNRNTCMLLLACLAKHLLYSADAIPMHQLGSSPIRSHPSYLLFIHVLLEATIQMLPPLEEQ